MHETDERATVRVLISQPLSVFKTVFLKNDFSLMVLVLVLLLCKNTLYFVIACGFSLFWTLTYCRADTSPFSWHVSPHPQGLPPESLKVLLDNLKSLISVTHGLDGFQEKYLEIQMLPRNPPNPWFCHVFTKSDRRCTCAHGLRYRGARLLDSSLEKEES